MFVGEPPNRDVRCVSSVRFLSEPCSTCRLLVGGACVSLADFVPSFCFPFVCVVQTTAFCTLCCCACALLAGVLLCSCLWACRLFVNALFYSSVNGSVRGARSSPSGALARRRLREFWLVVRLVGPCEWQRAHPSPGRLAADPAVGGIGRAVAMARRMGGRFIKVQVERGTIACDNLRTHVHMGHCHVGLALSAMTVSSLSIISSCASGPCRSVPGRPVRLRLCLF